MNEALPSWWRGASVSVCPLCDFTFERVARQKRENKEIKHQPRIAPMTRIRNDNLIRVIRTTIVQFLGAPRKFLALTRGTRNTKHEKSKRAIFVPSRFRLSSFRVPLCLA
jgi:hypothetical protein